MRTALGTWYTNWRRCTRKFRQFFSHFGGVAFGGIGLPDALQKAMLEPALEQRSVPMRQVAAVVKKEVDMAMEEVVRAIHPTLHQGVRNC